MYGREQSLTILLEDLAMETNQNRTVGEVAAQGVCWQQVLRRKQLLKFSAIPT